MFFPLLGAGDIQTTTQTLLANVLADGKISAPANVSLQSSAALFGTLSGNMTLSYWARTSNGGGGSITVEATDFAPSGGPVASTVSLTCSGATLGTGCSGSQALSTSMQTSLVSLPGCACTGGGGACSDQEPNTVLLSFSVPSLPHYKTGGYSAQLTFTISTM
jgi:hypothetical protein